jgi:hypothetical protein
MLTKPSTLSILVGMEDVKSINVAVPKPTHDLLTNAAKQYPGMSLKGMIAAWGRGWNLLTVDQQTIAIRGADSADVAPLCDKCGEGLPTIINRLQRDACDLDEAVDRALEDGMLTETEKASLRPLLRKAMHRLETAAAATR